MLLVAWAELQTVYFVVQNHERLKVGKCSGRLKQLDLSK